MTLAELLGDLDKLDDELTIFAVKNPEWTADSLATVCAYPDGRAIPAEAQGMEYMLEVSIAKEVMEGWADRHHGQPPTIEDKCRAIIYYAENDAYLPE